MFLATSRLFGWRARSTLYGFYQRDRLLDDAGVESLAITNSRASAPISGGGARDSRSSTAIASSATTRSIRAPSTIPFRSTIVANIAKLSEAIVWDRPRRSDQLAQGHVQLGVVRSVGAVPRLGRQQPQAADAAVRVRAARQAGARVAACRSASLTAATRWRSSDRFRAGGATSVRGYSEESLGPRDPDGPADRRRSPDDPEPGSALPDVSVGERRRVRRRRQHLRRRAKSGAA